MRHWLLLPTAILLTLAGCGTPEPPVVKRPPSGLARVVNLTADPITVNYRGIGIAIDLGSGEFSGTMPVGVGKQTLEVKGVPGLTKIDIEPQSLQTLTVIVTKDRKAVVTEPVPQGSETPPRITCQVIDSDGKPLDTKFTIKGPFREETFSHGTSVVGRVGVYTASGPNILGAATVDVQKDLDYTFLFYKEGEKFQAMLMPNRSTARPSMGGMSPM